MSKRSSAMAQKISGKNWSTDCHLKKKVQKTRLKKKKNKILKKQNLEKNWKSLLKEFDLRNQKANSELNKLKELYLKYSPKYQRAINNTLKYYKKYCNDHNKEFTIKTFLLNNFNSIYNLERFPDIYSK
ncbi:hypothetical protein ACKLNQ_12500 [Myroides odoratimimus]|uniref:hypothetical protein n=1 Tax=Myroides odoratimimus TaxID=76832 RepID=UPI0038D41871